MKIDAQTISTSKPSKGVPSISTLKPSAIEALEEKLDQVGDFIDDSVAQPIKDAIKWFWKRHKSSRQRRTGY